MYKIEYLIILASMLLSACKNELTTSDQENENSASTISEIAVIKEDFSTYRNSGDNIDSPAIWSGSDGRNWLLATAKEGNAIMIYDAATGQKISKFGQSGNGLGDLNRPNGIAVIDNLAVIVERDNHRVQVFSLPDLKPLGIFGESVLQLPYGVTIDKFDGKYNLYVTDNYQAPDDKTLPAEILEQRVHHFVFTVENNQIAYKHVKAFGATSGEGVLHKVESILIDRVYNRLLIADEHEEYRNVKVYDVDGYFKGQVISYDYFFYEPEGIVVWECKADNSGYYIMVDQGLKYNTFQVFDRETLEYIGGFGREITRNTDGIALTQKSIGDFKYGAFYPVHNDGSLTAIAWDKIADKLNLRTECD
jgi:3-phytase